MKPSLQPITIDYVNEETHKELHFPLSIFKKPSNQNEYAQLEQVLDKIIDEVRGNEKHPLAIAMQIIGDNLEEYDNNINSPIGLDVSDIELVSYIMKHNNLLQKDLVDIFGNQRNVSKFLNGERKLNKSQIEKLVGRFNLSADCFFKN